MNKILSVFLPLAAALASPRLLHAQASPAAPREAAPTADPYAHRWTVLAGLGQPLIAGGVNVAGTYFTRRLSLEYSHGMFLTYKGAWNPDKHIRSIYAPYSTGFGVGYRLTRRLDVRAEAKVHRFTAQLNAHQDVTYTNADLGLGAYYRWYPLRRAAGEWSGLVVEPSLRYWHHVASSLPGHQVQFVSDAGESATHKPYDFGLFPNVSIGYTFGQRQ